MLAKIENGQIVWYSLFKKKSLPVAEIEWAYLQQEDVNAKMCCGTANFPIGRLIVVKKDHSKEVFQYEGMDKPKQLLEKLHQANKEIAIGYTTENRKRFHIKG